MNAFIGLVVLMALAGATCARADVPLGGTPVAVPSRDVDGKVAVLSGMLWMPSGMPRAGVVFANGSGGWRDAREGYYGRLLAKEGYATLAVDSFGARGIADTVVDQSALSIVQMARDAFAARGVLIELGVADDRIAVMGGSRGGSVVLVAADATFVPNADGRFRAGIAFYPGCNYRVRVPKPRSALFIAIGEKDDYTGVKSCRDIAEDYARAGGSVTLKIYPDSGHQFDGDPAATRVRRDFMAATAIGCVGVVEPDGAVVLDGRRFDVDRDFAALIRYTRTLPCAGRGATMWTNLKQKASAAADVLQFLDATFPR